MWQFVCWGWGMWERAVVSWVDENIQRVGDTGIHTRLSPQGVTTGCAVLL